VFEFIQRFFGREPSSATAKERLRLVLLSDHLSLAPEVVEALKRELVEVISRYVEVDSINCDVTFEQQDKQVAMLANIPIVGMRNRPSPPSAPPSPPPPARSEPPAALENGAGAAASPSASAALGEEPEPEANGAPAQQRATSRRKRRRKHGASASTPAPGGAGFSAI
jgi:cell division topological specificity factor